MRISMSKTNVCGLVVVLSSAGADGPFLGEAKDTENLRNNGRMRVKFDKWLVHIPFLCYLTILLNLAEGAVYGGY